VTEAGDPASLQRDIEKTRAELAETIDAIADRLSPKRAATRGASAVKTHVESVFERAPVSLPSNVVDPGEHPTVARALRKDRVALVAGAVVGVVVLVAWRRSRR
jgi:hypothetical protein